jgi:hypothetical protein
MMQRNADDGRRMNRLVRVFTHSTARNCCWRECWKHLTAMYDKAPMDVTDNVHACFALFAAPFSYIVSTDKHVRQSPLEQCARDSPSTTIRWSSTTANPSERLEMGTSSLTLADARVSTFLSCANACSRCFTICECRKNSN